MVGLVLATAIDRWPRAERPVHAALIMWFAIAGQWYWAARNALVSPPVRATGSTAQAAAVMDRIRAEVDRHPVGDVVFLDNVPTPLPFMGHTASFPGILAIFIVLHDSDGLDGRWVRFVESDPLFLGMLRQQGGRAAALAVPSPRPAPASHR